MLHTSQIHIVFLDCAQVRKSQGSGEEGQNFVVAELMKVLECSTDAAQQGRNEGADDAIGRARDHSHGFGGGDGYSDDHAGSTRGARTPAGNCGTRSRRHSVVDDHRGASVEGNRGPSFTQEARSPLQLASFVVLDGGEFSFRDANRCDDVVVEDSHPALADSAHREFRVVRTAELAYHHDVQRCIQCCSNLGCDGYSAARESENDRLVHTQSPEPPGQKFAGGRSIPILGHCFVLEKLEPRPIRRYSLHVTATRL